MFARATGGLTAAAAARGVASPPAPEASAFPVAPVAGDGVRFHFSAIAVHSPPVQRKAIVGAPDDAAEREADAIADEVTRRPGRQATAPHIGAPVSTGQVSTSCACDGASTPAGHAG